MLSKLTGGVFVWGYPPAMSFEIFGKCQLHCPECYLGSKNQSERGRMSFELFESVIHEHRHNLWVVNLYFQGEALLHPAFDKFFALMEKHNIYSVISTNGNFSDPEIAERLVRAGLKKLIVSVDGCSQKEYEKYRCGGALEKVLSFINHVKQAKQKHKQKYPVIVMQSLVMKHNEPSIEKFKNMASELKLKLRLKSVQINHPENIDFLPENPRYRRYNIKNEKAELMNPLHNHCWRLYRNPVITSEGDVLPCCFDKSLKYKMGNLYTQKFSEIWHSQAYYNFRKQVFTNRKNMDICNNCSEGTKHIYV
ncbi:MAG: SPASM domain-containing protein [Candidatus Delongbacteria bacterium]|nr:SPASM domain-containing protein [Candidatus Delongbacteria bacterium]